MRIGDLGHIFTLFAFVTSFVAFLSYYKASKQDKLATSWKGFARVSFIVHFASVIGIIGALYLIIANKRYEYFYAYDHSSNLLPTEFLISCFWEGQEGSFLLWIFWNTLLGLFIMFRGKDWEAPVMTVFCMVQFFLTSMILGVTLPDFGIEGSDLWNNLRKIGSSPFIALAEMSTYQDFFKNMPDFVPEDGKGLNNLLQNYWMVIHPPTLFLGFALSLVPFSYAVAALWKKRYTAWVKPAMGWMLLGTTILGLGIMMGAYWAYETLNFGGYWNWDPVENAVYLPWLVMVISLHMLMVYKTKKKGLIAGYSFTLLSFLLVLYSTFLTRSGVLSETSVHSFTDLGLMGQLSIYLLFFVFGSALLFLIRLKDIPQQKRATTKYNGEFWIYLGVAALAIAGFQVFITITAQALFKKVVENQETYFSHFQIWPAIFIVTLSGIAQYFWWSKVDHRSYKKVLMEFFIISIPLLIISSILIYIGSHNAGLFELHAQSNEENKDLWLAIKLISYTLLLTFALFSLFSNGRIMFSAFSKNLGVSGGAITHIGIALLLIGIVYSSGFSKLISNNDGYRDPQVRAVLSKESIRLIQDLPVPMGSRVLTYRGKRIKSKEYPIYLNKYSLLNIANDTATTKEDVYYKDKKVYHKGERIPVLASKEFQEVEVKEDDIKYSIFPKVEENKEMNSITSHPSHVKALDYDLYCYVYSISDSDNDAIWSDSLIAISKHDTVKFHNYLIYLDRTETSKTDTLEGIIPEDGYMIFKNYFYAYNPATDNMYEYICPVVVNTVEPGYFTPSVFNPSAGMEFTPILDIENNKAYLKVRLRNRDYIDLKIEKKPLINLVWLGTILVILGMSLSTYRRFKEK